MVRVSNGLLGILNFVTFLLSVPILASGIWLARKASTDCERYLDKPMIALGVFLMLVSLAGLIGACCRVTWLLWLYLLVMFLLIVILFCFTIFAFVVTNKGAGEVLSGKGYKEYRLGDYSNWLQKKVNNTKNWNKIKSCLIDSKVCSSFSDKYLSDTASQFYSENLSPIQSGCCKPSNDCNFTYVKPTEWTETAGGTYTNQDCKAWSNDKAVLCYNCQACKGGLLQNIKSNWKKVAILNIIFLIFLIIVYSVGCCAFRNNRQDSSYGHPGWKNMPHDGWRPFISCSDPKGVVECVTIRKKSNYQKMDPRNEAQLGSKCSRKGVDKEEHCQGAQKVNCIIDSFSKGITTEDIAHDLHKRALDLQESLMMLRKLHEGSKYVARLKRKQEKSENSGLPGGREGGYWGLHVSAVDDEYSRKKIKELREAIRSRFARQDQPDQRKFEGQLEMPSTSSSLSSPADYNERSDSAPENKVRGLNVIAKLMGLEEIHSKHKLQDKILLQQKSWIHISMSELKKMDPGVQGGGELVGKSLKEIPDNMQLKGLLKSNLIKKTPNSSADDAPPIVLIRPLLEATQMSLKSQKLNEKCPGRRFSREEITTASYQKPGFRCSKEEEERHGIQSDQVEKVTKNLRRSSSGMAKSKVKCIHQSEYQVKANASLIRNPENRPIGTKGEASPGRSQNSREVHIQKENSTPGMQISKNTISKPPGKRPGQLMEAKSYENNGTLEEDGIKTHSTCEKASVNLERSIDYEDPTIISDHPNPSLKPPNGDSASLKERLLIDCTNELMECRAVCESTNLLPIVTPGSLRAQISLDSNMLEELQKGIENLSSYCKLASGSLLLDSLYSKMKRDLSPHGGVAVSRLWDAGWTRGFCSEDAEQAMAEVQETILSTLMEETLMELVKYKS
ncbi:hypothetical protein SAY87_022912 [Trapa incisa]|uniref:DUF4378 domain-containing protein n=1 Tax=Trapa incisa TaxID=236973 RepID=A0AAN7Q4X1_9MYRT|nr:hypothetical protein SAY87_022912 [Trapa incisa]